MNLKTLYAKLTPEDWQAFAGKAGLNPDYLRQLANGWVRPDRGARVKPSLKTIKLLAQVEPRLKVNDLVAEFMD